MTFNDDNMQRVGPVEPPRETTIRLTVAADGAETFESVAWDKIGSVGQDGEFQPLGALVEEDTLQDFLGALAERGRGASKVAVYEIVKTRGRTVEVRSRHHAFPEWKELAFILLGTGRPCEDFCVAAAGRLYAVLKTGAQLAAERQLERIFPSERAEWASVDGLARSFLGMHPGQAEPGKPERATAKRPNRRPTGNPLIVLQAMERNFRTEAPTIDELFAVVGKRIECPRDGRRREYLRIAVAALADTETNKWLWRHDGDRVALTAVLPGTAEDWLDGP